MGKAEKNAIQHWKYVEGVLNATSIYSKDIIKVIGKFYQEALIHGYKHGSEDELYG